MRSGGPPASRTCSAGLARLVRTRTWLLGKGWIASLGMALMEAGWGCLTAWFSRSSPPGFDAVVYEIPRRLVIVAMTGGVEPVQRSTPSQPRPWGVDRLDQSTGEDSVHGCFDRHSARFPFALAAMSIAEGEPRTLDVDAEVARGACRASRGCPYCRRRRRVPATSEPRTAGARRRQCRASGPAAGPRCGCRERRGTSRCGPGCLPHRTTVAPRALVAAWPSGLWT